MYGFRDVRPWRVRLKYDRNTIIVSSAVRRVRQTYTSAHIRKKRPLETYKFPPGPELSPNAGFWHVIYARLRRGPEQTTRRDVMTM